MSILILALAAAPAVPLFPVNYSSTVNSVTLYGPYHIPSITRIATSCDPSQPGSNRIRINITQSDLSDDKWQILRCDLGRAYELVKQGVLKRSCCYRELPATDVFCGACMWDIKAFTRCSGDCSWRDAFPVQTELGPATLYSMPGPCEDYLWSNTSVSINATFLDDGSTPVEFVRISDQLTTTDRFENFKSGPVDLDEFEAPAEQCDQPCQDDQLMSVGDQLGR